MNCGQESQSESPWACRLIPISDCSSDWCPDVRLFAQGGLGLSELDGCLDLDSGCLLPMRNCSRCLFVTTSPKLYRTLRARSTEEKKYNADLLIDNNEHRVKRFDHKRPLKGFASVGKLLWRPRLSSEINTYPTKKIEKWENWVTSTWFGNSVSQESKFWQF